MDSTLASVYHGNCHCGRYRFELSAPQPLETIACTCSLCEKKGYLWLDLSASSIKVVRDDGSLTEYQSSALKDEFCNHCGTGVLGEHTLGPLLGRLLVNLRAVQGLNPFHLEKSAKVVKLEDKRTTDLPPPTPSDSLAHHVGSCHCGKVQAELLVPIKDQVVKEDNCSLCTRNACIGVYPNKDQVRIHGREHTFEYKYGKKFSGTTHCKTCGVTVFSNVYGPPLSVLEAAPPERKERVMAAYWRNMMLQPLNVRALDGVGRDTLHIERSDEGTEGYVLDP
ncbi:Mss4-like protein [Lasiosphaeria hispida]|uniref:Mss4-like protein n=1 Tax=Lasiosphaeria hispida TaxID=260671 RepID=A0AAJ0MFH0_9PEZI|nr:Mss4-like protein [Lasiosphaeria hispida]